MNRQVLNGDLRRGVVGDNGSERRHTWSELSIQINDQGSNKHNVNRWAHCHRKISIIPLYAMCLHDRDICS